MKPSAELKAIDKHLTEFVTAETTSSTTINYAKLIQQPQFPKGLKGRALNGFSRIFVNWFHRIFDPYLLKRSQIDQTMLEQLRRMGQGGSNEWLNELYKTQRLIDGVKSEILFEINSGQRAGNQREVSSKILNKQKVAELTPRKLNLGSGRDIRDDYLNVDFRELPGTDVVADVADLPFEPESVDEILASHIIEHFTEFDFKKLLVHWYSLLAPTGKIVMLTPNIAAMAHDYCTGKTPWSQFRLIILGAQDYVGDFHYNAFSDEYLQELCQTTLPTAQVKVVVADRVNGQCKEIEIHVTKPSSNDK